MRLSKKSIDWVCRATALAILLVPVLCFAAPRIPGFYGAVPNLTPPAPAAVPQIKGIVQGVTDVVHDQARNKLTVNQDQPKAILDWHSFDIGSDAHTHFNQQGNADWAALNRIYDRNPSQIYGRLTADGKVFLINQNGILFSPASRVNVRTLVASSLNIRDEDFVNNALNFKAEDYAGHGGSGHLASAVSNHGVIETGQAGSVLMLAPTVENSGTISSPIGQVGLIAGSEADLKPDVSGLRPGLVVTVNAHPGEASNYEGGFIAADQGVAGMYGRVVNQDGIIRSISALKKGGRIELFVAEKVRTGENSVTACPVSPSSEREHESFQFSPGIINILGLNPTNPNPNDLSREAVGSVNVIEHAGLLLAPAGTIRLGAKERVYLEAGSSVDVSGAWVNLSGQENQLSITLNSVQLRDDYGQKEGILRGTDIQVNAREGSAVGDISGSLNAKQKTALEQAAKGGRIEVHAPEGEIILRDRARVSFAGGGVHYGAGNLETTKLLLGRKIHDISEADSWMPYEKILGLHETYHERFGISEEHSGLHYGGANPLRNYVGPHTEGSDGGKLQLLARRIILDGHLDGSVLKGVFQTMEEDPKDEYGNQTQKGRREPQGGALEIGTGSGGYGQDRVVEEIVIQSRVPTLPEGFKSSDPVPAHPGPPQTTFLSSEKLNEAGLGSISLMTNTRLSIADDALLNLASGGVFFATSRQIVHDGALKIPSGSVDLRIVHTVTSEKDDVGVPNPRHVPLEERIFLGRGSRISVAGERIDNTIAGQNQRATQARLDGGSISLKDETHLSLLFTPDPRPQGVFIMPGAVLDVSGGWKIDAKGAVTAGNAGTLHLQGSTVSLAGEIRGHSLPDATGGGLILHANTVAVGSAGPKGLPHDFRVESPVPEAMTGRLLHDWDGTDHGFTMIEIRSERDIAFESGVILSPSLMRLAMPIPGHEKGNGSALVNFMWQAGSGNGKGFHPVLPDHAGKTSLVFKAGELFETSQQVKDESARIVSCRRVPA
jgi:filamentous hemagglutinin